MKQVLDHRSGGYLAEFLFQIDCEVYGLPSNDHLQNSAFEIIFTETRMGSASDSTLRSLSSSQRVWGLS